MPADDIYVINGFYASMRSKYTSPGSSIYYFSVSWAAADLSWADFRSRVLGATDPATAEGGSMRSNILKEWESLGLASEPNVGDNGVHGSASPFEGLAEKMNWLEVDPTKDAFGASVLAAGMDEATLKKWTKDPVVAYDVAGAKGSLFDALEDMDVADCSAKLAELSGFA